MALPRGAMSLSAVCDCGISCSYSLTFLLNEKYLTLTTDCAGRSDILHFLFKVKKQIW